MPTCPRQPDGGPDPVRCPNQENLELPRATLVLNSRSLLPSSASSSPSFQPGKHPRKHAPPSTFPRAASLLHYCLRFPFPFGRGFCLHHRIAAAIRLARASSVEAASRHSTLLTRSAIQQPQFDVVFHHRLRPYQHLDSGLPSTTGSVASPRCRGRVPFPQKTEDSGNNSNPFTLPARDTL
jgi:hypothetical protein